MLPNQPQLQNSFWWIVLMLFALSYSNALQGQTPYLQQFTVENGLPSSNVYTAFEDSAGVMWFGTENGITRFDGYQFETFNMSKVNAATDIWGFTEDKDGRLWFSSQRQLTYLENNTFKAIPFPKKSDFTTIQQQFVDDKGNHFIRFNESNRLYKVDLQQKKLIRFDDIPIKNISHHLVFLKEDDNHIKWFFYITGNKVSLIKHKNGAVLNQIDLDLNRTNPTGIFNLIPINETTYLFPTNDDFVKIDIQKYTLNFIKNKLKETFEINSNYRTINGLTVLNLKSKASGERKKNIVIDTHLNVQHNLLFLNQFFVNELYPDKAGNIWICTENEGIYFLPNKGRKSQVVGKTNSFVNDDITTIAADEKGQIWFTNKDLELKVLKQDHSIHTIHFNLMNSDQPISYFDDLKFDAAGNLYIGSNRSVFIIIPKNKIDLLLEKTYFDIWLNKNVFGDADEVELSHKIHLLTLPPVKSLTTEKNKAFLVTSNLTISIECQADNIKLTKLTNARAYAVKYWRKKLWIGRKEQLFNFDIHQQQKTAQPIAQFPYPISALESCREDKLWIATDGNGLFRFDGEKTDTIKEFFDSRIKIKSLYVDGENHLWIATNKGIGKVEILSNNPFSYHFRMITKVYGLVSQEVNDVLKVGTKVYAATSKGLNIFDIEHLKKDTTKVPLFFTNFWVNNSSYDFQNPIYLSHYENDIKIDYLCLSYSNLGDIEYEYKMIGVDKSWQQTAATFKEYPTLQPGNYTFKIRAKNLDGLITDIASLDFKIKLPWWRTWIATIVFLIIFCGIAYVIFLYRLEQEKERNEQRRLKELSTLKSRFYSNITHEFRTPLTLIIGLNRQLKQTTNNSKRGIYDIIERHSYRLLNLINQLLDLNRLESKAMPLSYQNGDIIAFCKYIVGLFYDSAKNRQIHLTFESKMEALIMDFDADKVQSILFNLLSNALKFTPSEGKVNVQILHQVSDNQCIIKVKDSGIGINEDALAYVFNRYYQDKTRPQDGNNNTGIGLALVKELVLQMNGEIDVESNTNGTEFKIVLPTIQKDSTTTKSSPDDNLKNLINAYFPTDKIQLSNPKINNHAEKPLLLLVEDDKDLMQYLEAIVGEYYEIETAKNGKVGIDKAIEKVPDLIISDVMMPKKNGFELCKTLKNDIRTSHIPIILLTAKSNKEDEMKGLEAGAEVYMIKPFLQEELFLRINQLLDNRRLLQERYQGSDLPTIKSTPKIEKEDEFVLNVRQVIEKHIDKYDMDVNFLCEELHISRAQLHKKLTYLTGTSTRQFIKKIRLEKAEKLLKESDLNITEIAYETGFDSKYFSKVFSKTYGMSPTQYRKSLKG